MGKNKSYPLQLKWLHSPVRLLGIHVSYDEKGINELNFNLKIQKLQTNLDTCRVEIKRPYTFWEGTDN